MKTRLLPVCFLLSFCYFILVFERKLGRRETLFSSPDIDNVAAKSLSIS